MKNRSGVLYAQFASPEPPRKISGAPPAAELLASAFSIGAGSIGFARHEPSVYSAGLPLVFAPIRTRAALEAVSVEPVAFAAAMTGASGAYLYTNETLDAASAVYARMFPHSLGFAEDPATGAAAAAFAGVAHEFERPEDGDHEFFIEQGHKMGRPSRITLRMRVEGGQLSGVYVGGQTTRIGEGTLYL
jgi:trans-2,3-dihydro-3-hydroxyanthranilate isomerase